MYFISSLGDKIACYKDIFTVTSFKMKKGGGDILSLSPPLVSPETKFFCRKKKRIQIGRAMRIAPAEK